MDAEGLAQLNKKLQQLAIKLQLCPTPSHIEEYQHNTVQEYTYNLCTTQ